MPVKNLPNFDRSYAVAWQYVSSNTAARTKPTGSTIFTTFPCKTLLSRPGRIEKKTLGCFYDGFAETGSLSKDLAAQFFWGTYFWYSGHPQTGQQAQFGGEN